MGERIHLRPKGSSPSVPKISVRQLQAAAKSASPVGQTSPPRQQSSQGAHKVMAGQAPAKPRLDVLGIASMAVAGVSLLGLIISLVTRPDGSFDDQATFLAEENAVLAEEKSGLLGNLDELRKEHAQLKQSGAKLQRRLEIALNDKEDLLALLKRNSAALKQIQDKAAARERPPESSLPSGRLSPLTKNAGNAAGHGASCVCVTCRKKKNGGSLFPDL